MGLHAPEPQEQEGDMGGGEGASGWGGGGGGVGKKKKRAPPKEKPFKRDRPYPRSDGLAEEFGKKDKALKSWARSTYKKAWIAEVTARFGPPSPASDYAPPTSSSAQGLRG